ncbi:hypothetical protein [Roseateles sp. P5_E4]
MPVEMNLKLRQLHAALDEAHIKDLSGLNFKRGEAPIPYAEGAEAFYLDVNLGATDAQLANAVDSLLNNIARLKDHLKSVCNSTGAQFEGDNLINGNRDVAIIHDLWNLGKHAELNSSRSGLFPTLRGLQRVISAISGMGGAGIEFSFGPTDVGSIVVPNGATAAVEIFAEVVDQNGQVIDLLMPIAWRAVAAWEVELAKAGIPLPART